MFFLVLFKKCVIFSKTDTLVVLTGAKENYSVSVTLHIVPALRERKVIAYIYFMMTISWHVIKWYGQNIQGSISLIDILLVLALEIIKKELGHTAVSIALIAYCTCTMHTSLSR